MKKRLFFLIFLLCLQKALAQVPAAPVTNIDFSTYAPTRLDQFKGTCYAYASTFTALSVKYNILKKAQTLQEINNNAFSAAFTASMIRRQKGFFAKLFTLWSCSVGGNIEKAATVIQNVGAIPNGNKSGCCFVPSKQDITDASQYQIKDFNEFLKPEDSRDQQSVENSFKGSLRQRIPIVCAIHQTNLLRSNKKFDFAVPSTGDPETLNDAWKSSNHAVCIVGFDDNRNGGSFLLKNNYSTFGSNGLAWITYKDFMLYLSYALVLGDFKQL